MFLQLRSWLKVASCQSIAGSMPLHTPVKTIIDAKGDKGAIVRKAGTEKEVTNFFSPLHR